jgi:steroid delta-isomerase-like uncharacterized protein
VDAPIDSASVVRRYLALLERHDVDGLDSVVADDLVVMAPDGHVAFSDRAAWVRAMAHEPFTGQRIEVEDIVCEPGKVAVRYTLTASHTAAAFQVPATGRTVRTSGTKIYTIEDGRITRIAGHDDVLGLLRQLGVEKLPSA